MHDLRVVLDVQFAGEVVDVHGGDRLIVCVDRLDWSLKRPVGDKFREQQTVHRRKMRPIRKGAAIRAPGELAAQRIQSRIRTMLRALDTQRPQNAWWTHPMTLISLRPDRRVS